MKSKQIRLIRWNVGFGWRKDGHVRGPGGLSGLLCLPSSISGSLASVCSLSVAHKEGFGEGGGTLAPSVTLEVAAVWWCHRGRAGVHRAPPLESGVRD